ncbi:MAG: FtsX-like permease family protein [Burkholderiaceae bacterium]|nr:FtsX-like permease family protein [Burkholderiaceae bacterium]
MRSLLGTFSWRELIHHPWRNAAAVLAVTMGVALAFSVHLINASALSEFASAVRSVNGQPDLELRGTQGDFDEALYARVAAHAQVAMASPVLELNAQWQDAAPQASSASSSTPSRRTSWRVLGVDALTLPTIAPALMPKPADTSERMALFAPGQVFLNAAARQQLESAAGRNGVQRVVLRSGAQAHDLRIAGSVAAAGGPLAVMDIGVAQDLYSRSGQLSRIDLRLAPGATRASLLAALPLPAGISVSEPGDTQRQIGEMSRAYRVNLTVLALVALFTGAFLVFSVLSLSVAKRAQQFALLGVLGLTGRERLRLVLAESAVLGAVGSALGIALGTALAALALRLLAGDLGGGYFPGVTPQLQWDGLAALLYAALGVAAALVGGWWPARAAQRLSPAQGLKGLGAGAAAQGARWISPGLMAAALLLATVPPVFGLPLAAYVSVALLLLGGIAALPALTGLLYDALAPSLAHRLLPMLAVERARRAREATTAAIGGVVASLSLAVALTVMVASFRDSVSQWLDVVLPAQMYARGGAGDEPALTPELAQAAAGIPGVRRLAALRHTTLRLAPARPAVALLARPIDDPARDLPLIGRALSAPPGQVAIYVSEAMVDLYGAQAGTVLASLSQAWAPPAGASPAAAPPVFFVAGVWRDYARQSGAITMAQADYVRLSGERRFNDLALWLDDGADPGAVQQALRAAAQKLPASAAATQLEFVSAGDIRANSLRIFDRSFAVTYWLQAVAIAIGLFGIAASFSAQVLARRREFGLLAHLGLQRRQILAVVAGEGAAWTAVGAIAGIGLGLAVSVILVHVVNPQSFHWTMDLALPWARLLWLALAVMVAGTAAAWLAGRAAAGRDAVLAVKEDW